jgi:hypothetical protein
LRVFNGCPRMSRSATHEGLEGLLGVLATPLDSSLSALSYTLQVHSVVFYISLMALMTHAPHDGQVGPHVSILLCSLSVIPPSL